jgi:hypothetical protein
MTKASLDVRHGFLPDVTIHDFVAQHRESFDVLPFILIASIDSDSAVATMEWARKRIAKDGDWALSTDPLVIAGTSFVQLLKDWTTLSSGFDEIWLPKRLPVPTPPDSAYLVAPRRLDETCPSEVIDWMTTSGCVIGLGDGEGMNYVASNLAFGRQLGLPMGQGRR